MINWEMIERDSHKSCQISLSGIVRISWESWDDQVSMAWQLYADLRGWV